MSSASPGASHRKHTRRPGRKAPTLRPDTNTSVTAGGRVVKHVNNDYSAAKIEVCYLAYEMSWKTLFNLPMIVVSKEMM